MLTLVRVIQNNTVKYVKTNSEEENTGTFRKLYSFINNVSGLALLAVIVPLQRATLQSIPCGMEISLKPTF